MKKFFIRLIAAASAAAICITSVSAYSAQFDGEYFGEGFDAYDTDKMQIADGWSNGGMFDCTWSSANVGFSDGKLNLSIYGNGWSGYTGGEYRTNQTFGYGMYDVSMKPAKNDGIVSSFFTYTGPTDGTIWDEIDIEFLGKDTTKVQFNYYTNGVGNHEYLYDLGFDASEGFHHYGFYWGESSITWYVDEKPVYTATKDIPSTPGKIMMNIWNGTGVDSWLNRYNGVAPLTAQYDWISYTKPSAGPAEPSVPSEPSAPSSDGQFDSNQLYMLRSKNSGKALDLYWGSSDNGANVLQYTYNGYNNQKWYLKKLDNGYYVIENYASGKVLDVEGVSCNNGANVQQWQYGGGANQEWSIIRVDDCWKIINRNSGKALDVSGISSEDNANIIQWDYNGQANQLWEIIPV